MSRPQPTLLLLQKNYNLLAVNVFMAITGIYQLQRRVRYDLEQQQRGQPQAAAA